MSTTGLCTGSAHTCEQHSFSLPVPGFGGVGYCLFVDDLPTHRVVPRNLVYTSHFVALLTLVSVQLFASSVHDINFQAERNELFSVAWLTLK